MILSRDQIEAATRRFSSRTSIRNRNERLIQEKRYLEADKPERVAKFLARHGLSAGDAERFLANRSAQIHEAADPVAGRAEPNALERILGTSDLMAVSFLEQGLRASRCVGRVWIRAVGGKLIGYGTGCMVSPRLFLTNHHVLRDVPTAGASLVEFDYQVGIDGIPIPTTSFVLTPEEFFFTDAHLDYALCAVQATAPNGHPLRTFGWNPLIEAEGKVIIGQWMNIIQHPGGEPKQLALRENQLVDVLDDFLHYHTDTAPGSSGSPVFNDRWEIAALHHSGVWNTTKDGHILAIDGQVWTDAMGEDRISWKANEGVRVSRIVADLKGRSMTPDQRRLFDGCLGPGPGTEAATRPAPLPLAPSTLGPVIGPDGSVTWTVPLSISVNLGALMTGGATTQTADGRDTSAPDDTGRPTATVHEQAILEAARRELGSAPGVRGLRWGYAFENGWITNRRALVVTVRRRQTPAELDRTGNRRLPESFQGFPIEVTNPTLAELITEAKGPAAGEAIRADSEVIREEITYFPPPGASLDSVDERMRVIAHVSPDAGWPQLESFLSKTRKELVVGMYDFGAPHILQAVETVVRKQGFKEMTLVMQAGESIGEGAKKDDLHDQDVVDALKGDLGNRLKSAWVKKGAVNGWISSSYHIKVAVRDTEAFWLSSGNWQSSNQPNGDPLSETPPQARWLKNHNRDWHAIVEHPAMAAAFRTYLLHDYDNNKAGSGDEALGFPDLFVPEALLVGLGREALGAIRYFQPFDEDRRFKVQPLLTPDNYHEHALALVKSAQTELLIQNQTFNAPKENHAKLRELMDAVLERKNAGVTVRIIFRVYMVSDTRANLEALKDYGFDPEDIKVQGKCHTKAIIADRARVLFGSQNWSNDGVSVNRDASLLFDDEPLARYFAEIFDYDWTNLASHDIGSEATGVEVAPVAADPPPGMARLSWKEYMELM